MEMNRPLKGKSVTTSVPTIAVRFNATAEEIEDLYQSEDDSSEQTHSEQTKSTGDLESSPLKYLPRLGKRSASTDTSLTSHDSSPTSDPWKFFADIKGKITKNFEEHINEIKQKNQEGDSAAKKLKEPKDNLSDSEDISESSISKTCGAASTTEGVEMSSDEDTSSLEKDKKSDENPADVKQENLDAISTASPSSLRQRIRIIKKEKDDRDSKESSVSLSSLGRLIELHTGVNPVTNRRILNESVEVESGVEALEDTFLQNEACPESKTDENDILPEELMVNVTEKIDNLEIDGDTIIVKPVSGCDIKQSFTRAEDKISHSYFAPEGFVDLREKHVRPRTWLNILHSFRQLLFAIFFIILYIFGPIPVYFSGFIAGIVVSVILMTLYSTFINPNRTTTDFTNKEVSSQAELILTMPEIKEHIPISSFEGWVNEYPDTYNPLTYHVSQTQSVYIKLQGNLLRISHTRSKVPKRATWNEPKHKHLFTQHRTYNLLGSKVMLLPEGLHRKRHWSKKYPICIVLSKDQHNLDCFDEAFVANFMEDCHEQSSNQNEVMDTKKDNNVKGKKPKKKVVVQPQIYSKLSEENLDENFDFESPEIVTEMELNELDTGVKKLTENLLEEDDNCSQNVTIEDEEPPEEDVSLDDWSTYSPLESPVETHIYLFGRTGREKEDWFRRFTAATRKGCNTYSNELSKFEKDVTETISETVNNSTHYETEYLQYMSQLVKASKSNKSKEEDCIGALNVLWLNAVVGRVLYDWSRDPGFTNMLRDKIHRKLMSIKLPYFIEQLSVHELSLGNTSPLIHNVNKPILDQRGLWIDLDISYRGNAVLTLQTKLNLMKLKDPHAVVDDHVHHPSAKWQNSDVEDTAESSTGDEEHISPPPKLPDEKVSASTSTKSKRLIRVVDKITESKIFQIASNIRYIKKAMEGVSNTDLSLKVELKGLIGTLVLNIPPPPSDRLWIGFRPTPKMYLVAQPMVGVRNMSFIRYLTNWIEKQLCKEFQKLLVIPNMEDFSIPNMSPDLPK